MEPSTPAPDNNEYQTPKSNKSREVAITLVVLVAIVIIAGGIVVFGKDKSKTTDDSATTTSQTSAGTNTTTTDKAATDTTASTPTSSTYKDGTYKATGSYSSPGGQESVEVSVTLANGVVTDSTVTGNASDDQAEEYQSQFISAYKQFVTGKSIDSISLSQVSGSSLTSNGFNSALNTIKSEAKA